MIKQKKGFWVFICSLVPGAGEMYMGFRKQGLSIMTLFWGVIALASCLNIGFPMVLLPIIWCYSFFNVHNLKSLSEEEFYSLKDDYMIHLERFSGDKSEFLKKHRTKISVGIIVLGALALWNIIPFFFQNIMPYESFWFVDFIMTAVPKVIFAMAMIVLGIYLLIGKYNNKENFPEIEDSQKEYK